MRRSSVLFLSLLLSAAGARVALAQDRAAKGASDTAQRSPRGHIERDAVEVEAPPGIDIGEVRIDNRLGDVEVRGHDKHSILIKSLKRADDDDTLERLVVSLVPSGQGEVKIHTALRAGSEYRPVRAGSVTVDLIVYVPRDALVDAEVWQGKLAVSQLDHGAQLLVDKGEVDVKQVSGTVVASIREGSQAFSELFGDLNATSVRGDVSLNTVRGQRLEASVVRGVIRGEGLRVDHMSVRSVFGDVDLRAELVAGGHYQVSSRRGNVQLAFTGAVPVLISATGKDVMPARALGMAKRDGRWSARFQVDDDTVGDRQIEPAHLKLQAPAGRVVVKYF